MHQIQPPIQLIAEQITLVKKAQREGEHAHNANAEVKNTWSFTYPATLCRDV